MGPLQVRYVFYRLSDALAYCHRHRVVHRDIKPQNILVNKLCHPKLADWGLSNTFGGVYACMLFPPSRPLAPSLFFLTHHGDGQMRAPPTGPASCVRASFF